MKPDDLDLLVVGPIEQGARQFLMVATVLLGGGFPHHASGLRVSAAKHHFDGGAKHRGHPFRSRGGGLELFVGIGREPFQELAFEFGCAAG